MEEARVRILRAHGSYPFDPSTDLRPRYSAVSGNVAISDFDGVVNRYKTPDPMRLYLDYIFGENHDLERRQDSVFYRINNLQRGEDVKSNADEISEIFRVCSLTKELHKRACRHAADNFSIVSNYRPALNALKKMGYRLLFLSASPEDLIADCEDRLGIRSGYVEATRFHFDSHGIFQGMDMNLGETRVAGRDRLLERFQLTKNGLDIIIDDNPVTGVKAGFPDANIWLDDAPEIHNNVSVVNKKARKDLMEVPRTIKQLERGRRVIALIGENKYNKLVNLAHDIMDDYVEAQLKSGYELFYRRDKTVRDTLVYLDGMCDLFPSRKTGIRDDLKDLKLERDERLVKIMMRGLSEKFYKASLEAKVPMDLAAA